MKLQLLLLRISKSQRHAKSMISTRLSQHFCSLSSPAKCAVSRSVAGVVNVWARLLGSVAARTSSPGLVRGVGAVIVVLVATVVAVVIAVVAVIPITTVVSILRLITVAVAATTGTIAIDESLVAVLATLVLPARPDRASVGILGKLEDALATAGEMLGVSAADGDHLFHLGHQRVGVVAVSLHVAQKVLGGVAEEADVVELVVAFVGNARLVRIAEVEVRFGFLVNSDEFAQGRLLASIAFLDDGLNFLEGEFEVLRVGES